MARTTNCTSGTIAGRRARAEQFLEAAELVDVLEDPDQDLAAAYVTLCVHAGIAASDVICCLRLGYHASSQDHTEAVRVLETAEPSASGSLDILLRLKTPAGYSHKSISGADRRRARRAATSLVERMRTL